MSVNPQPPGRRGTVGHPYSALNLRLALALFGLVTSAGFAVFALQAGLVLIGSLCVLLAVVAAVDLVVIQMRRRARRRDHDGGHSLFE